MAQPAKRKAVYEDLNEIPENMTGEIINGELVVTPRSSMRHTLTTSLLAGEIIPPYSHGRGGGPSGWVIIIEPEIGLGENILVPDLAAWKEERFPYEEPHNWISVTPDWICEVISPSTLRTDKIEKMLLYARHEVSYCWLIDPIMKSLDAFR